MGIFATRKRATAAKQPNPPSNGPLVQVAVAAAIALLVGGTSPWWWSTLFPKPAPTTQVAECSQENLKSQLRFVGADKASVITATARTMHERFRLQDMDCVYGLAAVLLQDDNYNGHGLYYSGEVWRARAAQDPKRAESSKARMREHFFAYLDAEPRLPNEERTGKAAACYLRAKGYCAERTAWISHLLAIDYLEQSASATEKDAKLARLRRAAYFVKKDLAFGGFDQIVASAVLKRKITDELQSLDTQQGAQ